MINEDEDVLDEEEASVCVARCFSRISEQITCSDVLKMVISMRASFILK